MQQGPFFSIKERKITTVVEGEVTNENKDKKSSNSVRRMCTVTQSFKGSLSGSAEVNAFLTKTRITVQVEYGISKAVSIEFEWVIDPGIVYVCQWGHEREKIKGRMQYFVDGRCTKVKDTNAFYSKREWSGGYRRK